MLQEGITKGSPMSGENTFDKIIRYCQWYNISTVLTRELPQCRPAYNGNLVKVGNIVYDCNCHTTGNSVRGWILNDNNEAFEFYNTPFWHSYSYTFNDSKHIYGAWDKSVNEVEIMLRKLVAEYQANHLIQKQLQEQIDAKLFLENKSKFEEAFV